MLDTESFRSWAPADAAMVHAVGGLDGRTTAIIGDGQKGEAKSHAAHFQNSLLRACTRHRGTDLVRDRRAGKLGRGAYVAATKARTPEQVEKVIKLARTQPDGGRAMDVVESLPRAVQFPACAIAEGYGPVYGRDTSNDAEICWPMLPHVSSIGMYNLKCTLKSLQLVSAFLLLILQTHDVLG